MVVAWLLFAAVNWGWHFSVLYDQALENDLLHYFQHATFLAAALLFWWPAIGVDPSPWRLPHPVRPGVQQQVRVPELRGARVA